MVGVLDLFRGGAGLDAEDLAGLIPGHAAIAPARAATATGCTIAGCDNKNPIPMLIQI